MRNLLFVFVGIFYLPFVVEGQVSVTKIYIVRHADRLPGDGLSALGLARAKELQRVLSFSKIDSIFSTNALRTRQTVNPLATFSGLPTIIYSSEQLVINRVLTNSEGKRILIAGHSNTVAELIRKCGCKPPAAIDPNIPDTQFDNMFLVIVTRIKCFGRITKQCELIHMKYGAITN
jgi:phosphohistidine phosphatase SixA